MKNNTTIGFHGSREKSGAARYAVILAGGEGSRLKTLTRAIAGDERPKQFCPLLGGETLLELTRRRVNLKIAPEKTFYSLTEKHERFFRPLLAGADRRNLVVQPENKGTAPAILYSLRRLAAVDASATVAFFPSDHYFSDDAALMSQVGTAFGAAEMNPAAIVLLGIEPEKAETSYGWIEPVESLFSNLTRAVSRVERFWEKPSRETAQALMTKGCLWNSFVMVGKVGAFLALFEKQLPALARLFAAASAACGTAAEKPTFRSLYAWIDETNFSSEVLAKSAAELFVMRVGGVAWSDWGEPQRVLGTLAALGLRLPVPAGEEIPNYRFQISNDEFQMTNFKDQRSKVKGQRPKPLFCKKTKI
jgi:mannose-1-phosphate guanylyltransferase